jgi:hypothetical protein
MKKIAAALLTGSLLLFNSCHIYNYVTVSSNPATDFRNYKTYAWLDDIEDSQSSSCYDSIVRNNIRNYIGKELLKRGLIFDQEYPDLLFQLAVRSVPKVKEIIVLPENTKYYTRSDYYFPYKHDYYYSKRKMYCYPQGYCTQQVDYKGSVTINIIERASNSQIWSATALSNIYDQNMADQSIHPAVKRIMYNYPIKPTRN